MMQEQFVTLLWTFWLFKLESVAIIINLFDRVKYD